MRFQAYLGAFAALQGLMAAPAVAQSADKSGDEIIVTAQKREQAIQDVAAGVTALTTEMLEARGIDDATDLRSVVPSFQAGLDQRGDAALNIRGVGYNQVGSSGVAIHVDGVYQPRPGVGDIRQFDLKRVEVLRGPQGTLYGRNANGGVANFVSQHPTDTFEGYALASYASFAESRVQGAINVPLGENTGARLVLDRWERGEGFIENVVPGNADIGLGDSTSGRLYLETALSPSFDLGLILTRTEREGAFNYFTLIDRPRNPALATAIAPFSPRKTSANTTPSSAREYSAVTGLATWRIGDFTLRSVSGYQEFDDEFRADFDGTNISLVESNQINSSETFTQEVNLSGSVGKVDTVLGAFYMQDELSAAFLFNFPSGFGPFPAGGRLNNIASSYETESRAIFADATLNFTESFRLMAGIRYSEDDQTIKQTANTVPVSPPLAPLNCARTTNLSFNSTTPRVGLQYDVSSNSNVYASYSQGFKIGGVNFRSGCGDTYEPEELTSYEIGWKNQLLDGAVTINLSAFTYDYTNLQLEQILGLAAVIDNGDAEVKGFEVESAWRVSEAFTLNGTLSLLDAKFTDYRNVNGAAPPGPAVQVAGNRLPNAPETSVNVGGSYRTGPVIAGGDLAFRVDASYRSRVALREFNNPGDSQAAYTLLDASMTWNSPSDAFSVRLFGTNLLEEEYFSSMGVTSQVGSRFVTWGAPRQIGIQVRANF